MTTYFPFTPVAPFTNVQTPSVITNLTPDGLNPVANLQGASPFSFQPVLDGVQYNVTVPWSLFGQRYYVQCSTLSGVAVFYLPLIGSADSIYIQSVSWVPNTVTVTTTIPHGFKVGEIANITISNMIPSFYNGVYSCNAINSNQFTYALNFDPGVVTSFGSASFDVNIAAGYFDSTLVYRSNNQQFEVNP